ncbi:hypothetical protein ACFL0X_01270 [Nanoarchaeota archaeon]
MELRPATSSHHRPRKERSFTLDDITDYYELVLVDTSAFIASFERYRENVELDFGGQLRKLQKVERSLQGFIDSIREKEIIRTTQLVVDELQRYKVTPLHRKHDGHIPINRLAQKGERKIRTLTSLIKLVELSPDERERYDICKKVYTPHIGAYRLSETDADLLFTGIILGLENTQTALLTKDSGISKAHFHLRRIDTSYPSEFNMFFACKRGEYDLI